MRLTNYKLTVSVAGEYQDELDRALNENDQTSFVGKTMRVLRAYLDEEGNVIPFDKRTNGPMEYFFGSISTVSIADGVVSGNSTVKWECGGKFEDFNLVNGRITDDTNHRGLEASSNTQELLPGTGAKKPAYRFDTGFQHANQTINLISKYTTTETRYKMKSSWLGFKSKLKEYEVEVVKELELGVDLAASYLPFVRGVRRVPGIPIFLDNNANNPSKLYVIYAICEGPATLLNLYIDGESAICVDEDAQDTDMCLGNQVNGDTLSKFTRADSGYSTVHNSYSPRPVNPYYIDDGDGGPGGFRPSITPIISQTNTTGSTEGLRDVTTFTITNSTGVKKFTYYPGSATQEADPTLKAIAAAQGFFNQRLQGAGSEYWDSNSRLLDTAYLIMEMDITEEEQEVPELEMVVESHPRAGNIELPSLNPADHLLDYLTSSSYGGALDVSEIDAESFDYVRDAYNAELLSYESSWADYWRYIGWKAQDTHTKKLLECNTLLPTEETVTKNIESLLNQMDGTINQLGGKYHLSIEDASPPIADITIDEVIGQVSVKDTSSSGKWNSISANLVDPALNWSSNKLVFFDSGYLTQDKNVQKKGNVTFSHITNYYVARNWAKRRLDKSRYSREITIQTYYKYIYLYPNANVTFTYPRFDWDKKLLRVKSMTMLANGLVNLTLSDTDYSIYDDINDSRVVNPPIGSGGLPRPQGLQFVPADTADYNFSDSQDDVFGYLMWDPYEGESLLRYEVEDWRNPGDYTSNLAVPANRIATHNTTGKNRVYYPITEVDIGVEYLFKVRTLDRLGNYSKYSVLTQTFDNADLPSSYSPVTGFIATNIDDQGNYTGQSVQFTWNLHPSEQVTSYIIAITDADSGDILGQVNIPATLEEDCNYTFDISANMSMYSNRNGGSVGAYREYSAKIKAVASNSSSDWTNL